MGRDRDAEEAIAVPVCPFPDLKTLPLPSAAGPAREFQQDAAGEPENSSKTSNVPVPDIAGWMSVAPNHRRVNQSVPREG